MLVQYSIDDNEDDIKASAVEIRKRIASRHLDNKIKQGIIDEDTLFHEYNAKMKEVQKKSIATYGVDFSSYKFYSEIAQDTSPIDALNKLLNNYNLHVDYYPRTRDKKGNWIIDTIFLPIYK